MQQLPAWRSEPLWLLGGMAVLTLLILKYWNALATGEFILILAVLFLFHTLVRDLVIYWQIRRGTGRDRRRERCFCLQTPVGIIFLAGALVAYWVSPPGLVQGHWWVVGLGVGSTLGLNYLMRDLVIRWKPFVIHRDPAHFNIIPRL